MPSGQSALGATETLVGPALSLSARASSQSSLSSKKRFQTELTAESPIATPVALGFGPGTAPGNQSSQHSQPPAPRVKSVVKMHS